jgi:hypothetical protein
LGYLTFFLRVYTRLRYALWGIEDWFMVAALPPFTALSIACVACAFTGIGITNATLSLPGNEKYQELGLFVSRMLHHLVPGFETQLADDGA